MILHTNRLTLIACTTESERELDGSHYPIRPHMQKHISQLEKDSELIGWGPWLMKDKFTGGIIGDMGFKGKPGASNQVEIGYGIKERYWNQGYATEGVKALIEWAFHRGVDTITAECFVDNAASIRVLEKVKMVQVGQENDLLKWKFHRPTASFVIFNRKKE